MIIKDILDVFEKYWAQSLVFALLFSLFLYIIKGRFNLLEWGRSLIHDPKERNRFLLYFYLFMVSMRTLLDRTAIWEGFENFYGGWGIKFNGAIDYEAPENVIMFIPLCILLYSAFPRLVKGKSKKALCIQAILISFGLSLFIESMQAYFGIGTFQLADLTYNTLGGIIGCISYITYKYKKQKTNHDCL